MNGNRKTEPPQFLNGWKEIANYLAKGVRTVQRYERYLGLPVRRPAGKSRGSVVATKAEIDAWVSASPIREAFYLTKPPSETQYAASAAAVRSGLEEMRRLRAQLTALRAELRTSVHLLGESVQGLQGELKAGQRQRNTSPLTILEFESRRKDVFDLLAAPTRHGKAS